MVCYKQRCFFAYRLLMTRLLPLIQQLSIIRKMLSFELLTLSFPCCFHADVLRCYEAEHAAFEQKGLRPITLVISISHITWSFDVCGVRSCWYDEIMRTHTYGFCRDGLHRSCVAQHQVLILGLWLHKKCMDLI